MSNNDVIVLNSLLEQKRKKLAQTFSEDEYFELFTFEQALKDYDLSYDEFLSGSVDGADDGGIDGFFIFINGEILNEEVDLGDIRKNPLLEVYLIQSKISPTFQEKPVEKIISTICDIFDLDKDLKKIQNFYNSNLLEKAELFRKTYVDIAQKHPQIKVTYIYASKGEISTINPKIKNQSEKFSSLVQEYLSGSKIESKFLGARELLETSRQEPSYSLQLKFLENYISRGEDNYIILAKLKEYYEFLIDENGILRKYLFESNVRDYQGNVEVNRDIRNTLASDNTKIDFWWLNNGITILASKASVAGKTITLDDVQIVNGLQTTNTLYEYRKGKIPNENSLVKTQDERAILIKIIVTNDPEARDRIIKATNFQTPVSAASLRATEPIQRDIEDYFLQID